ncbi:MAG: pyridoxal phosphate-dependent aminotransferase [Candidatus Acidiferrales bacterium]
MFAARTNWDLRPNRLSEALRKHRAAGKTLIDLTVSNPTECGFEYEREAILRALAKPEALVYQPDPRGIETARQAVADYYAEFGHDIHAGNIFLTSSTSEAYSFVFRSICDPGDELLIPAPSYPLFEFLTGIESVRLVRYPLVYDHGWQIDFHKLEEAITARTRGVIVVHPNNPTGQYCKTHERKDLADICAEREIAIIADEVFRDFALEGTPPASFAGDSDALTFTLSGISKISGLPQMKLAWLVASGPDKWRRTALELLEVIADTYLSLSAPVQWALPEFLEMRGGFRKQVMGRVRTNLAELDRQLSSQKVCSRMKVEGGWNAVLQVPATRPDEELAIDLIQSKGVSIHPGHFYDFPRDGYLVASLITPEDQFAEGTRRILSLFASA